MIKEKVYKKAYIYLITVIDKTSSLFGKKYVGKTNGVNKYYITGSTIIKKLLKKKGINSIHKEKLSNAAKGKKRPASMRNKLKQRHKEGCFDSIKNKTLYSFIHKNGSIEVDITVSFMRTKYNLDKGNLYKISKDSTKSIKGWKILTI